jgi:hypothetical protein
MPNRATALESAVGRLAIARLMVPGGLRRRGVASPLRDCEDQSGFSEEPERVQHGIPAHSVLMLQVCHRRQRSRAPLARLDAPAQDRLKLTVRRNGQTGINCTVSAHKINLDHARPALISTYTFAVLL